MLKFNGFQKNGFLSLPPCWVWQWLTRSLFLSEGKPTAPTHSHSACSLPVRCNNLYQISPTLHISEMLSRTGTAKSSMRFDASIHVLNNEHVQLIRTAEPTFQYFSPFDSCHVWKKLAMCFEHSFCNKTRARCRIGFNQLQLVLQSPQFLLSSFQQYLNFTKLHARNCSTNFISHIMQLRSVLQLTAETTSRLHWWKSSLQKALEVFYS